MTQGAPGTAARSNNTLIPWVAGIGLTVLFYALLPYVPYDQQLLNRYFTAHWIEYATTLLFFVGLGCLAQNLTRLPLERLALSEDLFDGLATPAENHDVKRAEALENHLGLVARRFRKTQLVSRLSDACSYVRGRCSAEGLEGHLNYLAEIAAGRLHDRYALLRTITWAIPILGFLGTVIGITMAIANVTPEQLETSLNEVTAGLAVAFDTTALSLGLSMLLVFATFGVERSEQQVLDSVENVVTRRALAWFPKDQKTESQWLLAEQQAAHELLHSSRMMIEQQTQEWQKSLQQLQTGWSEMLLRNSSVLQTNLETGIAATLDAHHQQLTDYRADYVTTFEQAMRSVMERWQQLESTSSERRSQELASLAQQWHLDRQEARMLAENQSRALSNAVMNIAAAIEDWKLSLAATTEVADRQVMSLTQHGDALLKLSGSEQDLVRVQERLAENLELVRTIDTLQETVLNLNAAVNLMTARNKAKAA